MFRERVKYFFLGADELTYDIVFLSPLGLRLMTKNQTGDFKKTTGTRLSSFFDQIFFFFIPKIKISPNSDISSGGPRGVQRRRFG